MRKAPFPERQIIAVLKPAEAGGERISGNAVQIARERWPELVLRNIYGLTVNIPTEYPIHVQKSSSKLLSNSSM